MHRKPHHALADAEATAACFVELVRRGSERFNWRTLGDLLVAGKPPVFAADTGVGRLRAERQKTRQFGCPILAGAVDSTPSAAYHPLEPTTPIPVRASAIRCSHHRFVSRNQRCPATSIGPRRSLPRRLRSASLSRFCPGTAYASGHSHITVNAFRASLLGDIFFVAIAASRPAAADRRGFVDDVVTPYIPESTAHAPPPRLRWAAC